MRLCLGLSFDFFLLLPFFRSSVLLFFYFSVFLFLFLASILMDAYFYITYAFLNPFFKKI